jgi:hypothetical protein
MRNPFRYLTRFVRPRPNWIYTLRLRDLPGWYERFADEYLVDRGRPLLYVPSQSQMSFARGQMHTAGRVLVPDLDPWKGQGKLVGGINVYGQRTSDQSFEYVSDAEYQEWVDRGNYFRNGNIGLDPRLLVGGVMLKDAAYYDRRRAYYSDGETLRPPEIVFCPQGRYYPMAGPSTRNPFGVNSVFIFNDGRPPYQSDHWGPANRQDTITTLDKQRSTGEFRVWVLWDDTAGAPRPTQDEYNAARMPE